MKNFKAYVRTTLAASLVLTTGLLTACSGNSSGTSTSAAADTTAAAASGTTASGTADTTAANDTTSEKKELKYGKAAGPYTVLFEDAIKPILEEQGYTFTEVDFSDLCRGTGILHQRGFCRYQYTSEPSAHPEKYPGLFHRPRRAGYYSQWSGRASCRRLCGRSTDTCTAE